MYGFIEKDSDLKIEDAVYDEVLNAGLGWMHELKKGQTFRILDIEGNQAVDTTFYDLENPEDHYGAVQTIVAQKTGRHDTLGGACSSQSNTVRYAREKRYMHNCRDSFMLQLADTTADIKKRDLAPNINFFMNVPITKEGGYKFDDGVSAPGKYVEMKALADVMILISNCPQLNNPCNAYNPTPVRLLIWD